MNNLSQKQETFTLNLFKGLTQRESWIQAGYSSNYSLAIVDKHACELANKGKIKERLAELREEAKTPLIADYRERQEILSEIARGRVGTLLDENQRIKQGQPLTSAALQEVETMDIKIGKGENAKLATVTKIKLHNPVPAIDLLNRMDRVYEERPQFNDNRTYNIMVSGDGMKEKVDRLLTGNTRKEIIEGEVVEIDG